MRCTGMAKFEAVLGPPPARSHHRRRLLTLLLTARVSGTPRETGRLENMGEEDLDRLREQRLAALKKQQKKRQEWMRRGHGEYREVEEKEFFNEMKVGALLAGSDLSTGLALTDGRPFRPTLCLSCSRLSVCRRRERIVWCATFTATTGPARSWTSTSKFLA